MTDINKLLIGCGLFFIAHVISWFQMNSQFLWDWWRDRPLIAALVYAIPCSMVYVMAWRYSAMGLDNSVWGARFISFGISYLSFPLLTAILLGESMFTFKTMSCVFLSFCIVYIQVFK